ncbi:MAG: CocE/NonD family hydrolase [Proteobacteria bacterium]|nr:CocE/NonD family hydrolase [Pseudomonadota bacterium]
MRRFPLKKGATLLRRLPSYERWALDILTHGDYDGYWKEQRGYAVSEYYKEHADVPTLYLGGWYDSYARNTCESYVALRRMKKTPQYLLMGPWTHGKYEITHAGDLEFGPEAQIDYQDLKLAWFDHFLKGMPPKLPTGCRCEFLRWEPATASASSPAHPVRRQSIRVASTTAVFGGGLKTGRFRAPGSHPTTFKEMEPCLRKSPVDLILHPVDIPLTPRTRCPPSAAAFRQRIP